MPHHAAITTMGLKTSPHQLSIAANWHQMLASHGDSKYVVIIILAALVLYAVTSAGRAAKRAARR